MNSFLLQSVMGKLMADFLLLFLTFTLMKLYNQIFDNLETGIRPKSRESVLQEYFQKYLPFLTGKYRDSIDRFITWEVSYPDMLSIFTWDFFTGNTHDAVIYFLEAYSPRYSYGESELPPTQRKPYIREELFRFIDAFWPHQKQSPSHVPGTTKASRAQLLEIIESWDSRF